MTDDDDGDDGYEAPPVGTRALLVLLAVTAAMLTVIGSVGWWVLKSLRSAVTG